MAKPAVPTPDPPNNNVALVRFAFPEKVTPMIVFGVVVGFILTASALAAKLLVSVDSPKENLMMATGIALILSAFGGQGTIRGKAFVFAGVTAIAFGALWALDRMGGTGHTKLYVEGHIANLPEDSYKTKLKFEHDALAAQGTSSDPYNFIAFGDEIGKVKIAHLDIEKRQTNPSNGKSEFSPYASFTIRVGCFKAGLGSDQILQWKFQDAIDAGDNQFVYRLVEEVSSYQFIAQFPDYDNPEERMKQPDCQTADESAAAGDSQHQHLQLITLLSRAWAGEAPALSEAELAQALADLVSDDTDIRRGARVKLSLISPEMVPRLLAFAGSNLNSYRAKLGISVALAEMLRRDKSLGAKVEQLIAQPDIEMLLDFATDSDRTLRIYAGEFLYDLGSKAVARTALERAAQLSPDPAFDDARFNLIFVSQEGWRQMTAAERQALKPAIDAIGATLTGKPRTKSLLDNLMTM